MLVAVDLKCEGNGSILSKIGGVCLELVSRSAFKRLSVYAHQVENTGGALLLVGVLDEEEKALSGLAGPRGSGVCNLRLLATEVLSKVGGGNRLLAEPEVLLGEAESAAS